jgi:small subunit ribosomal protein S3
MGQKIHPLGFRLNITQNYRSHWFAKANQYPQLVLEDQFLRELLSKRFSDAGISTIEIQRKLDDIQIEISAARPGLIVGREKNGLESLRKDLTSKIKKNRAQNNNLVTVRRNVTPTTSNHYKKTDNQKKQSIQLSIHLIKLTNPNAEASFIADFLVEQLEKRVAFRKALRQAIQRSQRAQVKGIKIQISGRLNGAEIARTEWTRKGRVPLQTLRADIDYSYQTAKTIYGLLGIKIWVFKEEIYTYKDNTKK